ncbi:hypothetical protein TWF594_008843 [Orbilia oligospora]|nr:hypothetical protein TWF706_001087 [Orbilia oligospora]KAF3133978.1 hypothetical protein TWF594_008843 [Orbilia oligospora]
MLSIFRPSPNVTNFYEIQEWEDKKELPDPNDCTASGELRNTVVYLSYMLEPLALSSRPALQPAKKRTLRGFPST